MPKIPPHYLVEHIRDALATDPRIHEIELHVKIVEGRAVITGTVPTEERRRAVSEVLREGFPDLEVDNQTTVARLGSEPSAEELG